MNLLLQSFFYLQLALGGQVTTGQVTTTQVHVQKPEKNLTVTVAPQTQASPKNGKQKVEWKQAYTLSFLDEDDAKKQLVFMVPANLKMVRENYLGVFTTPVSLAMSSQFSRILAPGEGLLVDYVHAKSPAAISGCKPHDILVSIGKTKLKSSRQLRELVIGYADGQRVELSLVRTAKLQTIKVELAKRKTFANFSFLETKNGSAVENFKLKRRTKIAAKFIAAGRVLYAPVDYRLNGRRMDRGYLTFVKLNANNLPNPVLQPVVTTRSISVDTRDGKTFVVGWNTRGGRSNSLRGTLFEIRKKSSTLPEEFQAMVLRNLDVAEASLTIESRSLKFHVKPRLVGKDYALRLNLVHPSAKENVKAFRCFELDHIYTIEKPVRMTELLTLELLNSELELMKPSYRNAVVATIEKLPAPKVKVEIENSQ